MSVGLGEVIAALAAPEGASGTELAGRLGLTRAAVWKRVEQLRALGLEVESVVDAPNTYAVFVTGPDGIRIEYVEHKSTFALA